MQLLVIRHAIAEEREAFAATGAPDDDRPVTPFGKRRMRRNLDGLRRIAPSIDILASSPLLRAQQTARLVADCYHIDDIVTIDALRPEQAPKALATWLGRQPADATIAVVGHEPHLGTLITWFMTGTEEARTTLKKGGVALLDFAQKPGAGRGELSWLVAPAHLRALGD